MPRVEPFEQNVDKYEVWFEHHRPVYESELEAIRVLLPKNGEGLEVGVGTGRFAALLGIGIGIDPSPAMSKLATERGIEVRLGVGENLPYEDSHFNFVLLVTTICFLDDVPAALSEAYRVLRPGGNLLIGLVDRESPLGQIYESRKQDHVFYRDATFLSTDEVVTYMKQAGFCDFVFRQTIFQNLNDMKKADPATPGYGEGAFVVVRGTKPSVPMSRDIRDC